ncbi:MAG: hypothetical protein PWQ12_1329 [Clostridiales bacterium]|jgi:microcystin-dependent protein|nr:hypothetical protein [Clostridiales bacterium]
MINDFAFVGQISMVAGNYVPMGWLPCDGATLSIAEFQVLYAVIGNRYGGDGVQTFRLPDLRDRIPNHRGNTFIQGTSGGSSSIILSENYLPPHRHDWLVSGQSATSTTPTEQFLSMGSSRYEVDLYSDANAPDTVQMAPNCIGTSGASAPLQMHPPISTLTFMICYDGVYPQRS